VKFETALATVLQFEGDLSNNAADPGKLTLKGITESLWESCCRRFGWPVVPVTQSTEQQREFIYKSQFWNPAQCALMPDRWALPVFDMAVNSGPREATYLLQAVLKSRGAYAGRIDGIVGPMVLHALAGSDPHDFVIARLGFWVAQGGDEVETFINGWTARDEKLLEAIQTLASTNTGT
jgi:lysozyme family protein